MEKWQIYAIVIVIILAIVGFLVQRYLDKKKQNNTAGDWSNLTPALS